jgi:hypothetical protein
MPRKTPEQIEKIKNELNILNIWSFSKLNQWRTDKYTYFLRYILKIKPDKTDGIYAVMGNICHDILEKYYKKEIKYSDMIKEYESAILECDLMELKYNKADEDKNLKTAKKYEECIKHFFLNHNTINNKLNLEDFILIKFGKQYAQGYMDVWHIEEINNKKYLIITDWKTSTIYTGKKIIKERDQLLLYAKGMSEKFNIPYNRIIIRWNFLKYVSVLCEQVNGKIKNRNIERNKIGDSLKTSIKMWLNKKEYNQEQINNYIKEVINTNSINNLPLEVLEKFKIQDCYVSIEYNEKDIIDLEKRLLNIVKEIEGAILNYEKTNDEKIFWEDVTDATSFYFCNLCEYSVKYHKPYKEYIENLNLFTDEEDDLSWMDELL